MPLPKPKKGEKRGEWMDRCMGSGAMNREFPRNDVRTAVCSDLWRKARGVLEAKEVGLDVDEETQRRLDTIERQLPDSRIKRVHRRQIDSARIAYTTRLGQIAKRVSRPNDVERAVADARAAMLDTFSRAYIVGIAVAGLPDWEVTERQVRAITEFIDDELVFFERFMRELASEARDDRIGLYGGAIDDLMWRGWNAVAPSDAIIEWRLSVAEHCPDCLALAANSPCSKAGTGENPLPTVPRNGDTRCLGNCKCYLEMLSPFESTIAPQIGVEITGIGGEPVDPMSPEAMAVAESYRDLAERLAWHHRMALLEPGHDTIARALRQEIDRLAERFGHRIRFTASLAEITQPITTAMAMRRRFIPTAQLDDDLLLAVATVVALNWSDRGEITNVQQEPPIITLADDPTRVYRIDEIGRNILFLDE
jgi:hypothetical protein